MFYYLEYKATVAFNLKLKPFYKTKTKKKLNLRSKREKVNLKKELNFFDRIIINLIHKF